MCVCVHVHECVCIVLVCVCMCVCVCVCMRMWCDSSRVQYLHQVLPCEVVPVVGDTCSQSSLQVCNVHLIPLLLGLLPEPLKVSHLPTRRERSQEHTQVVQLYSTCTDVLGCTYFIVHRLQNNDREETVSKGLDEALKHALAVAFLQLLVIASLLRITPVQQAMYAPLIRNTSNT